MSYRITIFRIILTIIVFISMAGLLSYAVGENVRVGIFDFDPFCRTISPYKDGGLFLDILHHIASKEGWRLEYVAGPLPECMERLKNGEIHLMVAATYSEKNKQCFDFTRETVISTWAQVYALDSMKFQSINDLKNCTIGLIRDDPYNQGLRRILKGFDFNPTFAEFNYSQEVFRALRGKWIDVGVVDRLYGALHEADARVKRTTVVFLPVELRFAATKNQHQALIDVLDYHLNLLKKDTNSIYYQVVNRTLGKKKVIRIPKVLVWILTATIGLSILLRGISLLLCKQVAVKTTELHENNLAMVEEIRERRLAEEALRENEEKFRLICEQALKVIAIIQDDVIKYANQAFSRLSEYSMDEVLNWGLDEYARMFHPDDRNFILEQSHKEQQGNTDVVNRFNYRFYTKSGKMKWVEHYSRNILYKGQYASLITLVEITEAKEAREILAAEKDRLAVTLRSIGDGIIATNNRGEIVLMNRMAETITGWKQEEAQGKPVTRIFQFRNGKTNSPNGDLVHHVLQRGTIFKTDNDVTLQSSDGSERIILTNCAPIRDRNDQMIGAVLVIHDITEKRKLELEIQKALKLEAIGVLAAGIAHEFNNLMAVVIGNIGLAKRSFNTKDKIFRLLDEAEKGAYRATGLCQQLLTFSKGGALVKETASIQEIIKDSVSFVLQGSATHCDYSFQDNLFPVDVDKDQISLVFQNLIINADQAMPCGGIININVENMTNGRKYLMSLLPERYIKITIRDQGVGIPQEHLDKIFNPFFTTKEKGYGLGLSVVYSVVRKHDGHITVESELGKGTVFHIYVPVSKKDIIQPAPMQTNIYNGEGRILVMDDNEDILEMMSAVLKELGYQFTLTKDGKEAIRFYQRFFHSKTPFDAVIMDLTIAGGMGGKEAIIWLKKIDPHVKAVVSSGYSDDPVIANYKDFGFKGVIKKPFDIQQLSQVLREVVNN
jgi:PAS domain S-box-containing protein